MYAEGTSGASDGSGVRSVMMPPGRHSRPSPSSALLARRADAGARANPRVDRAPRPGRRPKSTTSIASRRVATYRQAIAADPQDAGAYRGLASALWLSITFRRGNMTVDDYLGTSERAAPAGAARAAAGDRRRRSTTPSSTRSSHRPAAHRANPSNADAHYQLGAAIGLRASYIATVDDSVARRVSRRARGLRRSTSSVLALDPQPQGRRPDRRDLSLHRRPRWRCPSGGSPTSPASAATRRRASA